MATKKFSVLIPYYIRSAQRVAQAVANHLKLPDLPPATAQDIKGKVNRPKHLPEPGEEYGNAQVKIHFGHGMSVTIYLISFLTEEGERWAVEEIEALYYASKRARKWGERSGASWNDSNQIENIAHLWGNSVPAWKP